MWSMGVVLFVMLHGYPCFYADPAIYGAPRRRPPAPPPALRSR
jgi:hypothetical protein